MSARYSHTSTIAKDRGLYRAVLYRNGTPVHRGDWHERKHLADLDRRKFVGDPWTYAPAFLPANAVRLVAAPREKATNVQLGLFA